MPAAVAERFQEVRAATTRITGTAAALRPDELQGLVAVDRRYQVLGPFAEGGQGIVNTARDRVLERFVAIKSLRQEHVNDDAIVAGFVAEAKVTAQLDHPAIVPLYDLNGDEDGRLHIAMKLIFGQTLKELVDDAALSCRSHREGGADGERHALKARLEHFIKACDAVSFAHDKGVVHRDLKPENVMVGPFHEVYVMDWGIAEVRPEAAPAEAVPAGAPVPGGSGISGTPGYIAPEIIADRTPASPASDQYALGMILFELATLKRGLRGEGMAEIFNRTIRGEHESLLHLVPCHRIPADLAAIIRKATARGPSDRYASVTALADDVRRFLQDEETVARPDNLLRSRLRWLARHRALAAGMALAVILALVGIAGASFVRHQREVIRNRQRQLLHVHLQARVAHRAHRVDRHMQRMAELLGRLAERLVLQLEERGAPPVDTPSRIANQGAFQKRSSAPGDLAFSAHYQQPVSLSTANAKLAPQIEPATVAESLRRLDPVVDDLLAYLAAADPGQAPRPREVLAQQAFDVGLPITWISIGLAEGAIIAYPGSGSLPEDYDPRQRPWYRDAVATPGFTWSAPYIDAAGVDVIISVSQALHDRHRHLLGVAAFDLTLAAIQRILASEEHDELPVVQRYLVDRQGNIILRKAFRQELLDEARQELATIRFEPYPHPQIRQHLDGRYGGQFEVVDGNRNLLVACAPVPSLGWFLVEEIDLSVFLARHRAKQATAMVGTAR
jgi:serine/threonine-protein kinase